MTELIISGVSAAVGLVLLALIRPRSDGSERIKNDTVAILMACFVTGCFSFAIMIPLARLLS
jgi:hypothetical protein